jgi:hypothetical protein
VSSTGRVWVVQGGYYWYMEGVGSAGGSGVTERAWVDKESLGNTWKVWVVQGVCGCYR